MVRVLAFSIGDVWAVLHSVYLWIADLPHQILLAIESGIQWVSDALAVSVEYLVDHLPALPHPDWSMLESVAGVLNAWFPSVLVLSLFGLYLIWWVIWNVLRIILKLVWSG